MRVHFYAIYCFYFTCMLSGFVAKIHAHTTHYILHTSKINHLIGYRSAECVKVCPSYNEPYTIYTEVKHRGDSALKVEEYFAYVHMQMCICACGNACKGEVCETYNELCTISIALKHRGDGAMEV